MSQIGVLEFLEEQEGKKKPPQITTVQRTTNSKYLFYLVVRHYRTRLKPKPQFLSFTKGEANAVKGLLEEHSFWAAEGSFYVLEGFDEKFIRTLSLPDNTYLVAETTEGDLKPEGFNLYAQKRNILKVLVNQLGMTNPLNLSTLIKLDWSQTRSYDDFEPVLRKAKFLCWSPEELEAELEGKVTGNPMVMLKKGNNKQLLELAEQLGDASTYSYILNALADLLHYRTLKVMGYEQAKCQKEMDISWKRAQDLEEANTMVTQADLVTLSDWFVRTDRIAERYPRAHIPIIVGLNPTQLRK